MTSFSLFSPLSSTACAERLRATLGPGRKPLVVDATHTPKQWPAYGDVTGATIALSREPATLLGHRPKPARLLARMTAQQGGTVISGSAHPLTWAVVFFLIWLLISITVTLDCLVPALQDVFDGGVTRHRMRAHDLVVTVVLPVAGLAMLIAVDGRWRAQADELIQVLMRTLDAVPHAEPSRRAMWRVRAPDVPQHSA